MGYLDEYAESSWPYGKLVKAIAVALLVGLFAYAFYWLFFRNWREERQVDQFLSLLEQRRYEQAYERWGCSVADPCRYYPYEEFLEDWGPGSPLGAVESYDLGRSYTQAKGVIVELAVNGQKQPNLWVESDTGDISFFPY